MNLTSKRYLSQVKEVIKKAEAGEVYSVYLFIGDRPIIHPQINKLIDCLVLYSSLFHRKLVKLKYGKIGTFLRTVSH